MRRAIVAFACAVMLAASPAAARAAPLNGQIAAVADGRLVTLNADGSGLRTLWTPQAAGEITGLAFSPEGNRLAFSYAGRIVIFDVAAGRGAALPLAAEAVRDVNPAWSPDGRRIGFRRIRRPDDQLRVTMLVDGSDARAVALDPIPDQLAWAPDLQGVALVVGPLLLRLGVDVPLVTTGVLGTPAWSPDGERIAFADGTGLRTVTTGLLREITLVTPAPAGSPRWAPDGLSLLYPAGGELRTVAIASGTPRVVLGAGVTAADWQPCTAGVTVSCVSVSPPRCSPGVLSVTTQADQPVDLPAASCSDPAGRDLSLVVAKAPDHGSLAGLRYTPAPGFTGQDVVIYRMSNGAGESGPVRVSIFVVPRTAVSGPVVQAPTVRRAPFLSARATPRLDRQRRVLVKLSCDQDCKVAVRLTARLRSKRMLRGAIVRRSIAAGRVVSVRLRLPSKPRSRPKTVWITGTVTNAGLTRSVKLPVTLPR